MKRKYGWKPDTLDARDIPWRHGYAAAKLLPHVDLRTPQWPAPFDQGVIGSCTGNMAAAALAYEDIKAGHRPRRYSRLFIYYNERAMEGTVHSDAGATIRDAAKVVCKLGACTETAWPYAVRAVFHKPLARAYLSATHHKAIGYRAVKQDLTTIRTALAMNFPVMIGFSVYDSFESEAVALSGVVPMPDIQTEKLLGGHAALVVGYDDASERFIVRNSWGTDWGNGGYCTMPYAYILDPKFADDFWILQP